LLLYKEQKDRFLQGSDTSIAFACLACFLFDEKKEIKYKLPSTITLVGKEKKYIPIYQE
jgi:hypothetical protein